MMQTNKKLGTGVIDASCKYDYSLYNICHGTGSL